MTTTTPIRLISDLHLDHYDDVTIDLVKTLLPIMEKEDEQNLIIAGDFMVPDHKDIMSVLGHLTSRFKRVILVLGNHDYWGGNFYERVEEYTDLEAEFPNKFFVLEKDTIMLENNVLVAGATLWTDMNGHNPVDIHEANTYMNDYRRIKSYNGTPISAKDTILDHELALDFFNTLTEDLDTFVYGNDVKLVVVTHHLPTKLAQHPKWANSVCSAAYYANCDTLFDALRPSLWLFGHQHDKVNLFEGTRFISNPSGYESESECRAKCERNLVLYV